MNQEKRRRRAKRKAKMNRLYRSGGLERLLKLSKEPTILNTEDVRKFGKMDTRFTRIYAKGV